MPHHLFRIRRVLFHSSVSRVVELGYGRTERVIIQVDYVHFPSHEVIIGYAQAARHPRSRVAVVHLLLLRRSHDGRGSGLR